MGARAPCVSCMRAVPCGPQCPREILQELVAEVESRRERRTGGSATGSQLRESTAGVRSQRSAGWRLLQSCVSERGQSFHEAHIVGLQLTEFNKVMMIMDLLSF